MKQSEAVLIPPLLAARVPRPVVEEATIEGVRMLVIIGNEVDTVIRYSRSGSVDMPQLSSYSEKAEAAAHADERLAKQRVSGRRNTTGEGVDWPRNWKLAAAKTAGKIWYEGSKPERKAEIRNVLFEPQRKQSPSILSAAELLEIHEEYRRTVPNSYDVTRERIEKALTEQNVGKIADVVADWLRDLNRQYYRFRPEEARDLSQNLKPLITAELTTLLEFRRRRIAGLTASGRSCLVTSRLPTNRELIGLVNTSAFPSTDPVKSPTSRLLARNSFSVPCYPSPHPCVVHPGGRDLVHDRIDVRTCSV